MPRRVSSDERSSRPSSLADDLVRDFGRGSDLAKRSIRTLYATLDACQCGRVEAAFASWSQATACTGAAADHRADAAWSQLAAGYGLPVAGLRPERLLFVLQTYYAIVVQRLLAGFQASLEGGEPADASGASIPPEPAEFDWYLDAQDATVAAMLAELVDRLAGHARRIVAAEASGPQDLFKPLYQDLFVRRLRHALGEYYTPDWLAESLLDQVGYQGQPGRRLLDPACGSGTFLVAAVRRARACLAARAERLSGGGLRRDP